MTYGNRERELLLEAQEAWVREVSKNIGLGIVWDDDYRRLINMTADQRLPLSQRTRICNVLCAREAILGTQQRLLNAPGEIAARLREERVRREEILEIII